MPGPCQDQAGTSRGGEGCGGAPALPSPPGRCEAIPPQSGEPALPDPPPISWVVLGFVSLGKSQTSKAAAGSGGSTAPPRAGAGGWGLAPPQLCVELLQPRGGGSEGLAGTGPQLPPPPKPTWDQEPCWDHGRGAAPPFLTTAFFSPPAPPPFFFSPLSSLSSLYMFGVFVCVPQRQTRFNKPETSPSSVPFVPRALSVPLPPLPPCPPALNCLRK